MATEEKIRYALVGAGNIAQVAVLPAFRHARENSRLIAVISGDAEKRNELRARYDLEVVGSYEDFERVLERGDIDAVYITTPNTLHKEFTLRAAAVGVHVLCEKPMAPTVSDCLTMASACADNGVKLMIAYRLHFEEANLRALEIATSGEIGEVRAVSSFFSHVVRADDIRRDVSLAGGAAYDLGVYCINAARHVFQDEPLSVFATVSEREGTDDTTSVILSFSNDRVAQFVVSNSIAGVSTYRIAGTHGDLRVDPAFGYVDKLVHHLTIGEQTKRTVFKKRDQFAPEIVYFSTCIQKDLEPEPSAEEGICDVRVVEAILKSAAIQMPVSLERYQRQRHPTMAQELQKPALRKPPTVHAPSPAVR
jgi:predicted dehydrogenase